MKEPVQQSEGSATAVGGLSEGLFERAVHFLPGGVSRATIERDPIPRYMEYGAGAYLVDVDGRRFLDLNGNFTTLIHGHAFPAVVDAVTEQLKSGSCFANPTRFEIKLAELLCDRIPYVERVRFVNTGTEAVMFAIKAARAYTGRSCIAKIEGAYHGSYDWAEVSQGAAPDSWGPTDRPHPTPGYSGTPHSVLEETLVLRFNAPDLARRLIAERAKELAAVIVDPMPGRPGLAPPDPEFVRALHESCREYGIVLIADEVLNLRQGYHGASARFGLEPDLITMGKIIGGGLPIGAIGGRRDIMTVFDGGSGKAALPQSGTFSANPISMVAGFASMQALDKASFDHLDRLGESVRSGFRRVIAEHGAPFSVSGAASLFRIHPSATEPAEFRDAFLTSGKATLMRELSRHYAANGVLLPSGTAACLSTPMQESQCETVVQLFAEFLHKYAGQLDKLRGS
ncbi:aspartate aminotransferase family protein [Mesorhizobium sp. M0317]|uniref:aspartate aminotransferase family protein n=1 Tax=Mesorhizobium sp. M0317 TaxID=2956935 RepID=UPI00333604E8